MLPQVLNRQHVNPKMICIIFSDDPEVCVIELLVNSQLARSQDLSTFSIIKLDNSRSSINVNHNRFRMMPKRKLVYY